MRLIPARHQPPIGPVPAAVGPALRTRQSSARRAAGAGLFLAVALLAGCSPLNLASAAGAPAPTTAAGAGTHPARSTSRTTLPAPVVTTGQVVKVTDGDTIHVAVDGGPDNEDVRIIGVDTPEVVDPRKPVQCFGPQASARAHTLLDGARVTLSTDPTQASVDVHGRALRVVTLPDGSDYAESTVAAGYGRAYKVRGPAPTDWATLTREQADARAAGRGLWAPRPTGCGGGT